MVKRNVKNITVCLQPDIINKLRYIESVAAGPGVSRSQLVAECIQVTYNLLEMKKEYEGLVKSDEIKE